MPDVDEGPFLREEKRLIDALSMELGRFIERMKVEEQKEDICGFTGSSDNFGFNDILHSSQYEPH